MIHLSTQLAKIFNTPIQLTIDNPTYEHLIISNKFRKKVMLTIKEAYQDGDTKRLMVTKDLNVKIIIEQHRYFSQQNGQVLFCQQITSLTIGEI